MSDKVISLRADALIYVPLCKVPMGKNQFCGGFVSLPLTVDDRANIKHGNPKTFKDTKFSCKHIHTVTIR